MPPKNPRKITLQKAVAFGQRLPGMLEGAGELTQSISVMVQQGLAQFNKLVQDLQRSGIGQVFAQAQRDWAKAFGPIKPMKLPQLGL